MVISVETALEIDQKSILNQFVLVEENNTSDGSFIISSITAQELKKEHKIIIILFHHTIGHYHSIGQKLGYNLLRQQEIGNVIVFEFLNIIFSNFINDDGSFKNEEDFLKNLYLEIKNKVTDLSKFYNVTLIIENLGNLLLLGFKLNIVLLFFHYCYTLFYEIKNFSVTCLIHNIHDERDFEIFVNSLRHKANLNIILNDLETGKASDVTGKLIVKWRSNDLMQWNESSKYHYQLMDKNILVFVPGTKNLF